jgi:uncharacterized spore protein YtfJ
MDLGEIGHVLDGLENDSAGSRIYGQPYETADGSTVVPVVRVRGKGTGAGDPSVRISARPAGVFVIKDGAAKWEPAVDATRVAMMGILVGLVSATLAGIAMVRRPPWPDLKGDVSRH